MAKQKMDLLPDDIIIIINKFVGLPFKDELLNYDFKRYFSFYLTPDKEMYYNHKKWGQHKFKDRKQFL
jgi:hypothetical protein